MEKSVKVLTVALHGFGVVGTVPSLDNLACAHSATIESTAESDAFCSTRFSTNTDPPSTTIEKRLKIIPPEIIRMTIKEIAPL